MIETIKDHFNNILISLIYLQDFNNEALPKKSIEKSHNGKESSSQISAHLPHWLHQKIKMQLGIISRPKFSMKNMIGWSLPLKYVFDICQQPKSIYHI